MCAIVGWIADAGRFDVESALHALRHRGPDASGHRVETIGGLQVGLAQARLSIIDLSTEANQPFVSADGRHVIVYNGEIYNFRPLRAALTAAGVRFRTRSDTEVLLGGLAREGLRFLPRLDGMFAFAWLDRWARRVVLCRDRLGIKPLYYQDAGDAFGLAFASEMRGLRALTGRRHAPDTACLAEFLLNGFLYEPQSGVVGVHKVPPGHVVEIGLDDRSIRTSAFVSRGQGAAGVGEAGDPGAVRATALAGASPCADLTSRLDTLLRESVASQRVADVPLGLYFSAGIDSSVLAAAATGDAITGLYLSADDGAGGDIGIDAPFVDATATALRLPVRRVALDTAGLGAEGLLADFAAVARGVEEPISDYTFVASAAIARAARSAGFTVMLSGMGGDEVFGGYPRYRLAAHGAWRRPLKPLAALADPVARRVKRFDKRWGRLRDYFEADDFGLAYTHLIGYFPAPAVHALLGESAGIDAFRHRLDALLAPVATRSPLQQAMHLDRTGFLAHNLTVTDKSSMQHGIEVRVPLLSNALVDFGERLPDARLLHNGKTKVLLSEWLARRVPSRLVYRPKAGFNPPLDRRIRQLERGLLASVLTKGAIATHLDPAVVSRYVAEHFDGRANHTYCLWQLVFLASWLESFDA
ncbi:MAG: asparagine synthase (glutamine-hydrolyzing) [Lautropia sp.]